MKHYIHFFGIIMFAASMMFSACGSDETDKGGGTVSVITISEIPGVVAPVRGEAPVTTTIDTDEYTGTIAWAPADDPFEAVTVYTAIIVLTAKTGFTLTGVPEDYFTVAGATASNAENSGTVTAEFAATGAVADTDIVFSSVTQVGGTSGSVTTTGLTLTFNADPTTLTASNITITGATKGALTGTGTTRSLAISAITVANGATITVILTSPIGYAITGSPKNVVVYKADTGGKTAKFTADGVTFILVYVPGGKTFPTGTNDEGTATVANAYWIGQTEVTYELWKKVHTWAVSNGYTFANSGAMGDGTGDTIQHPVSKVSWRDAMVWCNALTEWYNSKSSTSYACVYTTNNNYSTPIRTATDSTTITGSTDGSQDDPYVNPNAKGFRLSTSNEWELAARYLNGTTWLYGDHVSGDTTGACHNDGSILGGQSLSTVFGNYAVYDGNSGASTVAVKSKTANSLGLYDMSGNVWEWCFGWYTGQDGTYRVSRGGCWNSSAYVLRAGYTYNFYPYGEYDALGFRFARTQ
jgi:formylglycine-generating enzyme